MIPFSQTRNVMKKRLHKVFPFSETKYVTKKSQINHSICVCQSARNKVGLILDYIRKHGFDIVAMTETWFRSGIHDQKAKGDITLSEYKLRSLSRVGKCDDGIDLLFKKTLSLSENVDLTSPAVSCQT